MSYHSCDKCKTTENSGAYFRYCYRYGGQKGCDAEYCNNCSYRGQKCPRCGNGYLMTPDENKNR